MPRKPPSAAMKRHLSAVADMGCLVCGGPAQIHHIMHAPGKVTRRDDRWIVALCRAHHQDRWGVHGLGSERAFAEHYGIDLLEAAKRIAERLDAPL
jgi:hypothetical protein